MLLDAVYTVMSSDPTYNLAYTHADTGKTLGSEIYMKKGIVYVWSSPMTQIVV